ncbi:SHOCT domain-containing protein [Clostridium sp. DJ247]|uniref:SHOCT domain-containing protein n=1 Tax=Clostridium sp. DJ247 TaxID=2726188 RepID=UPI00162702F0|nr:SHOCT domain-containing protein [Clostridium sp. DJ247]MBC2581717.1 SHOCT domain-containing protein [Clostridium sp. DJ247]
MRHNFHWGLGFYSPYIMTLIVLVMAIIIYFALKYKAPPNIYFIKVLDTLKEKYAEGLLNYDNYIERKAIIEEYEYLNPYSLLILERYAKCEIDITELFKLKKVIENETINSSIRENLAKGVLSYNDYEKYNK